MSRAWRHLARFPLLLIAVAACAMAGLSGCDYLHQDMANATILPAAIAFGFLPRRPFGAPAA